MQGDSFLEPRAANFRPLTPLDFLDRQIACFPNRKAVIWRDQRLTWRAFGHSVQRLVAYLRVRGIGPGNVVSIICLNRPEMLAAHYAVPAVGAVLNSVNTRLDAAAVAWILGHAKSQLLLCDPSCSSVAKAAAQQAGVPIECLAEDGTSGEGLALLAESEPPQTEELSAVIKDEWQPIALNYTSGTTGNPRGVLLHHRGAWLNAIGNVMALGLDSRSVYLWVLPMFHCNGWCHTWAVTAAGGVHVCLEKVEAAAVFDAIAGFGISHMSCAPVVLYMLLNDPAKARRDPARRLTVATGGASPTAALIGQMDALGFDFIHLYGLTESYGPTSLRALTDDESALPIDDRATLLARQGMRHVTANRLHLLDEDGVEVPADGRTVGEIVLSGNTLLAGYYRDPEATEAAFTGGGFHTGDLAVRYPEGEVEIRDRSKDVIITGGENVSSLEIESVLHRHPQVLLVAVVARPDPKWGEVPMAFVEVKPGAMPDPADLELFCRDHLPGFKIPRAWAFEELPKTATGKIQKFVLRKRAGEAAYRQQEAKLE